MILVVLNDGETFTFIEGCKVVLCPESKYDGELSKEEIAQFPFLTVVELLQSYVSGSTDSFDVIFHEPAEEKG